MPFGRYTCGVQWHIVLDGVRDPQGKVRWGRDPIRKMQLLPTYDDLWFTRWQHRSLLSLRLCCAVAVADQWLVVYQTVWQLDDDTRRALDDISSQSSDSASSSFTHRHHQLVASDAPWRTDSEADAATPDPLLQRLFDQLVYYTSEQVHFIDVKKLFYVFFYFCHFLRFF